MKLVIIESPFRGDIERNKAYLHAAVLHCLSLGESPYASHAFFTQFLDDKISTERNLGILAGLAWGRKADFVAAYQDFGISEGMSYGIAEAKKQGLPVQHRWIIGEGKIFVKGFDSYIKDLKDLLIPPCLAELESGDE